MEDIFAGYPCAIIVDDLLIWGKDDAEHDDNLARVLQRAREVNLRLNISKCKFMMDTVSYVGHKFTRDGLKPDEDKIEAIKQMPIPEDKQGVQRLLGMLNYLNKFIPDFSDKTEPLRQLLHKDIEFTWGKSQQNAFELLQKDICTAPTLKYFDPSKNVKLSVDASKSGLGAVCLQDESPVAYASRSLSEVETRYAQIEKELLAAVFACRKFYDYIYGRKIIIETDHKPLITIFKKPLHKAPVRLQRMLLQLQRFNFEFQYKRGKELHVADALSRAYMANTDEGESLDWEVMSLLVVSDQRQSELQQATATDPEMQALKKLIIGGWPKSCKAVPPAARDYFPVRDELLIDDGVIVKGISLVIPKPLRKDYIDRVHRGHPGIKRSLNRAKEIMHWSTMKQDIEEAISKCPACNSLKAHNQKETMINHPVPKLPYEYVSADIFEWNDRHYLITVDAYSNWFDIDFLSDMTSKTIIKKLRERFATHGIPMTLMSDNGRQFVSREFKAFATEWDFKHVTSSPNFPQSNGQAENAVKQAKQLMEKSKRSHSDPYLGLLNLRNIPRDEKLGSPSQRLFSRRTRTTIPIAKKLMKPKAFSSKEISTQLQKKKDQQKRYYDKTAKDLDSLKPGQVVRLQTDKGFNRIGKVKGGAGGPRSYRVIVEGKELVRNRKHLLPVDEAMPSDEEESEDEFPPPIHVERSQDGLPLRDPVSGQDGSMPGVAPSPAQPAGVPPSPTQPASVPPSPTRPAQSVRKRCCTPRVSRYGRTSKPNPRFTSSQWYQNP